MNDIIESANYKKAVALTQSIKVNAKLAEQSLYEVCKGLKEIHDDKLYKELGYENFESYSEDELNIKRHMAYKYVTVAEIENVESIQHLGITKLSLLAKLDETERQDIQQTVPVESVSVRELKAKIADLKKANDRLIEKVDEAEKKAENSRKSEEKACGKLSVLQTDTEFYKKKIEQLEREISEHKDFENLPIVQALNAEKEELEAKIRELENRPVEVAVADNSEEIEKLKEAAKEAENKYFAMIEKMSESDKEHADEVKRIKAEYEKRITESKAETVTVSDDKAIFKAYLSNAVDASKRLIEFIKSHESEPFFKDKTRELFNSILMQIEDKT